MSESPITIKKVDGAKEAISHCLQWMQLETMPLDTPLESTEGHWWIAYQGGNPVAFCALKFIEDNMAYLSRAGVLAHARGNGLQKKLIRVRVRYAKRNAASTVVVDTADNPASANSLISEGFRMYIPENKWGLPYSVYWFKHLK